MRSSTGFSFSKAVEPGMRLLRIIFLCLVASPVFNFAMAQDSQSKPRESEQEKRGLGVRPTSKQQSRAAGSTSPKPDLILQTGHVGRVMDVSFTSDSRRLVSCGDRIRVWDVATGRHIRSFGHDLGTTNVELSPDGKLMASSGSDKVIKLWDTANWTQAKTLAYPDMHKDFRIDDLRFSPDGRILIALRSGGDALLWEITAGRFLGFINDKTGGGVAFSPDSRWLIAMADYNKEAAIFDLTAAREVSSFSLSDHLLVMTRDYKLAKLDANDPRIIVIGASPQGDLKLTGHTAAVRAIAFSPDGSRLASAGFDKTVKLWEVATGRELRTFSGHALHVTAVSFSADGKLLTSADMNATKVWDISTGREIASFDTSQDRLSGDPRYVSFTPDKRWVIRGTTGRAFFWEQATGRSITTEIIPVTGRPYSVTSPDGQWSAFPGNESIELLNRSTREAKYLTGYPPGYQKISFSRDGRWLAWASDRTHSDSGDNSVRIWETATGQMFQRPRVGGARNIDFSPDGKSLVVGGVDNGQVFDVMGGKPLMSFHPKKGEWIEGVAFSPDAKRIASSRGNEVRFWDAETGREALLLKPTFMLSSHSISPDWRLLAMAEMGHFEPQNKITIWNAESGAKLRELRADYFKEGVVAFSPDGRTLAAGGNSETIKLWDATTGSEIRSIAVNHGMFGTQLIFSPDGRVLVSSGADAVVRLWDVATGKEIRALTAHTGAVKGLAFHPGGQFLASSSADGSVILWEVTTGAQLALMTAIRNSNDWLVVTPDGLFDGSPQGMAKLVAWRFADDEVAPLEILFSDFYYPGLLAEILSGKRPKAARSILDIDRRQPQIALKLVDPQASDVRLISSRNIKLRVEVAEAPADKNHIAGSGARDVRLFRNGSLVKVWRGDVAEGKAVFEASVPIVSGDNHFTAYAFNRDNVKSLDATLIVKGDHSLKRQATAHVLVVGINEYANPEYNLKYAIADVEAFAAEFHRQQSRLSSFASIEIITLADRDATKANILEALKRLAGATDITAGAQFPAVLQKIKPAQPEDAVIVYFAGHGTAQQSRFYLIPHDLGYRGSRDNLDESSLNAILSRSISDLELERAFEGVDAANLLLVIDACNSGQALEAEEKRRGPMNSKGLAQLAYEKGMYILTAAQSYQAALEAAQLGHGYLTYALVEEGLKTAAADSQPKDGKVMAREWLDYATLRVPQMQLAKMREARDLKIKIAFLSGEESLTDVEKKSLQRPRVFYRRELESLPLVIAKP